MKEQKFSMRLARWMAKAGLCSRREAERWILQERVCVNGQNVLTPACCVTDQDRVVVDGLDVRPHPAPRLWRYYKPLGVITTHRDPQGRPTVFEHLPSELPRVISVGRLDLNSEGLLLLTNDGALARFLEHPQNHLKRMYRVRVYGALDLKRLKVLEQGMTVEGVSYRPIVVSADLKGDPASARNHWLTLTLEEGKNREIRKIMNALDLQVNRLIRTHYGPFELGSLKSGEIAEVTPLPEMAQLTCQDGLNQR